MEVAVANVEGEPVAQLPEQTAASLPGEVGGWRGIIGRAGERFAEDVASRADAAATVDAKAIGDHQIPPKVLHHRPVVGEHRVGEGPQGRREGGVVGTAAHALDLEPQPAVFPLERNADRAARIEERVGTGECRVVWAGDVRERWADHAREVKPAGRRAKLAGHFLERDVAFDGRGLLSDLAEARQVDRRAQVVGGGRLPRHRHAESCHEQHASEPHQFVPPCVCLASAANELIRSPNTPELVISTDGSRLPDGLEVSPA